MNSVRARGLTTSPVSAPTDFALFRTLAQTAPKSWTPAKNIVPTITQRNAGNPAPDDGDAGSDNRCRTGDGGEMVAPEHNPVGGYVVDVIPLGVRGRFEVGVELIDLFGNELRVEPISEKDHRETDGGEQGCVHLNDTSSATWRLVLTPHLPILHTVNHDTRARKTDGVRRTWASRMTVA